VTVTLNLPESTAVRDGRSDKARVDIQALRAIAVVSVVLYHLWPNRLSGGYVGVDVFFVISGFLITSHLLTHPPRRLTDLLQFWSRRIRRLLPASLLVLLVTLIATRLLAPDTLWANTARYVRAAALYGVNWRMAGDSVDYLAANDTPTPVQHFWSLSVEEQFYLGWPILIALLVLIARRRAWRAVTIGLVVITAASFWYSVRETAANPAAAYFITPTRVWELGVGGCLAAALARPRFTSDATPRWQLPTSARTLLAWFGLAAIVWTLFEFTDATPFPSWRAALPVLGAAAVIAANVKHGPGSPLSIMSLRPIQWLGGVSYSIYLWHWPLLALLPYKSGGHLGRLDKVLIILATLVLSALTRRYVEDRFRTPGWARPLPKPYVLGAAAMALVVGASLLQTNEIGHRSTLADRAAAQKLAAATPCFGAAALAATPGKCPPVTSGPLTPSPSATAQRKSEAWDSHDGKNCFAHPPRFAVRTCTSGSGTTSVALIGNSHAGQWYGAMSSIAEQQHWSLTSYVASECAVSDVQERFSPTSVSQKCLAWVRNVVQDVLARHYDLVVMSDRISVGAVGYGFASSMAQYEKGYEQVLRAFQAAHLRVVVIRDTPAPGSSVPDCLATHTSDYTACDGTRQKWLPKDPTIDAVRALDDPDITSVDLTDRICEPQVCGAVVGGVPAYFDNSHLSEAFAMTLAPYLKPALLAALAPS